jgi:hypothetical protein
MGDCVASMDKGFEERKNVRKNYPLSIVLVGKKEVQRRCRVLNVSQGGMMLNVRKDLARKEDPSLLYPVDTDVSLLFVAGKREKKTFRATLINSGNRIPSTH